jgi:DNA polymerase
MQVSASGGTPRNLTSQYDFDMGGGVGGDQRAPRGSQPAAPVWTADGQSIIVRVGEQGNANIVRVNASSGDIDPIAKGSHDVISYTVDNAAKSIAFVRSTPTVVGDLHVISATGGQSRKLTTFNDELFNSDVMQLGSLREIAAVVESCTRCVLSKTATRGVPGSGNPNADFMCVGEGPGANEDEQGLPFVGAAGQLLTKSLAAVNLSRDEVFITNVVKHRPPGNRNPAPDEITACLPYLVRQLELIKPKVILALGTFAAQTLLDTKTPIGKLRGEVHRYHGIPVVVTYHPAALLRNPSWKRPTWEDVQLARRILDSATGA